MAFNCDIFHFIYSKVYACIPCIIVELATNERVHACIHICVDVHIISSPTTTARTKLHYACACRQVVERWLEGYMHACMHRCVNVHIMCSPTMHACI